MRVLNVIAGLASRMGGPAINVVESGRALERCGAEVVIWAPDLAEPAASRARRRLTSEDMPAGTADLNVRIFRTRAPWRMAYAPSLGRELSLRVVDYDIVHIHSLFLYPQLAASRQA